MELGRADGNQLSLSIVGYQFPDAEDPRKRFSWNMVEGSATSNGEHWEFRWQALTCDEPPHIVSWLHAVATWIENPDLKSLPPAPPVFIEPNLRFEATARDGIEGTLAIELNAEFTAPSTGKAQRSSRYPTHVILTVTADQLRVAARELAEDIHRYPDGLADHP